MEFSPTNLMVKFLTEFQSATPAAFSEALEIVAFSRVRTLLVAS